MTGNGTSYDAYMQAQTFFMEDTRSGDLEDYPLIFLQGVQKDENGEIV